MDNINFIGGAFLTSDSFFELRSGYFLGFRGQNVCKWPTDEFRRHAPCDHFKSGVNIGEETLTVYCKDKVQRRFNQCPVFFFTFYKRCFCLFAFRA